MIALIDGDIICYRAGFASQKTIYRFIKTMGGKIEFPNQQKYQVLESLKKLNMTNADGNLQKIIVPDVEAHALQIVYNIVTEILKTTGADSYEIYLTSNDKTNFRYSVAKRLPYKGNRKQPRPAHYDLIRDYLEAKYKAIVISNMEADDELGIRMMECKQDAIICTIDKDLNMIPGAHYNFVTKNLYTTSDPGNLKLDKDKRKLVGGGLIWFYSQLLLGDSSDNIPGIPGYGPVKVFNALKDIKTEDKMLEVVYNIFKKEYKEKAKDNLAEVMDLLWIQRERCFKWKSHILNKIS